MRDRVTLGSLCYPASSQINLADETMIDYIDISSVNNASKCITGYQSFPFSESPSRARKSVRKNSIIISTVRPNLNAVALFEIETPNVPVVSTGFCVLDCKQDVDIRFVFNFCKSKSFVDQMVTQATGASYPAVSDKIIRSAILPSYSYEEQYLIGNTLESISCIINSRKKQLQQLDDLIKARFVEMFGDPEINSLGWPEANIGDNCFVTKLAGFEYTNYIHYKDNGDVVMVKAQNVKNGVLNDKELSYITKDVSDSLPRSQLAPGDIVMTYVGANIGDVAIIDDKHFYHLAPNVAKIRPAGTVYNPVFFMYMLMMKTNYIMRNSADTAKAALGMERIRKLNVFVPNLDIQNDFASFVAQVDKSKSVVQKALDEAQLLFDSLMQQYFG